MLRNDIDVYKTNKKIPENKNKTSLENTKNIY